jgi:glutamate synthase (NADPH/NADH) large chain
VERTASPRGIMMLYRFKDISQHFVKVIPTEYARALELTARAEADGASHEDAIEIAFETMRKGE